MATQLYCYRFRVISRQLAILAHRHGHSVAAADVGYQVHSLLKACFGSSSPKPFAVEVETVGGDVSTVLAYGRRPFDEMADIARAAADVQAYNALVWDECAAKPLPERWRVGARYRFRVRVCPVRRGRHEDGQAREIDAFLAAAGARQEDVSAPLSRASVYQAWVREQIEGVGETPELLWKGGAEIEHCRLEAFQLRRLVRHDAQRRLRQMPSAPDAEDVGAVGRPDATLGGILRIVDSARFSALLARGVGRHRAFGFGMVRLEPV